MSYSLFHCHSYMSLLDGFGSPTKNVQTAKKLNLHALSISDHGTVAGHMEHLIACKKAKVKPILGIEVYCTLEPAPAKENRNNTHMVMWAKNKSGLESIWKMHSLANTVDYFYYKPRIQLKNWTHPTTNKLYHGIEHFAKDGNIMAFSGHQGSHLSDNLFADIYGDPKKRCEDIKAAYNQSKNIKDSEHFRKFLKPNWLESTCEMALDLQSVFGKGNFFIELQDELNTEDKLALWIHPLIVECLRKVSKETGIMSLASSDPHYPTKEDAKDQRIMISVNMKETEATIAKKFEDPEENDIMVFFGSDSFYIHSYEEMAKKFTKEELENTNKIADLVEEYDLVGKPYIPKFIIPDFNQDSKIVSEIQNLSNRYLMSLCIEGAKDIKPWEESKIDKKWYWERLKEETDIIFKVGLSDYFLIVQDICKAADNRPINHSFDWQNWSGDKDPIARGVGRGSAAGCLLSYLTGITDIDPMLYELSFSRFYNAGRFSEGNVSLPDIDLDFSVKGRDWIIEYIKYKYGTNNVAQMITFQTMKGRAALKDVIRVKNIPGGFELSNKICEYIPNEAEIADEIQEVKSTGEDYNILKWALDNSEEIQKYYEDKELKPIFDQAIRCEGTKRGQGKHPSGLVIVPKPVEECFPMTLDPKSKQQVVGLDMRDAEKIGATKFDILGVCVLDKLKMVQDLVNGKI
jgi:DNA polymerase-3 subunit alpha